LCVLVQASSLLVRMLQPQKREGNRIGCPLDLLLRTFTGQPSILRSNVPQSGRTAAPPPVSPGSL
jgi:hypothetical protein